MTQAYRCPDPLDEDKAKRRPLAMRQCSDYLRQEILIVRPRVILCFGGEALKSVKAILSPSGKIAGLKTLFLDKTILEWRGVATCASQWVLESTEYE